MLASTLLCLVVAVADGDTVLARCGPASSYTLTKVRIAAIDAPEKTSPTASKPSKPWPACAIGSRP